MHTDDLQEQDYNNYIYLKKAITKILPLVIKNAGFLNVISCSKCIVIIPLLASVDISNYIVKCSHIIYTQENKFNTLIVDIV